MAFSCFATEYFTLFHQGIYFRKQECYYTAQQNNSKYFYYGGIQYFSRSSKIMFFRSSVFMRQRLRCK